MPDCCYAEGTCPHETDVINYWMDDAVAENVNYRYAVNDVKAVIYTLFSERQGFQRGFDRMHDETVREVIHGMLLFRISEAKDSAYLHLRDILCHTYLKRCHHELARLDDYVFEVTSAYVHSHPTVTYTTLMRDAYRKELLRRIKRFVTTKLFPAATRDVCERYADTRGVLCRTEVTNIIKLIRLRPTVPAALFGIISAYVIDFQFDGADIDADTSSSDEEDTTAQDVYDALLESFRSNTRDTNQERKAGIAVFPDIVETVIVNPPWGRE